ncbi:hypothetical protein ebA6070 [Aromatoleum aromaticum EbN1]|uniref:Uncharacterized protein n=1 Tax=Aromatoleum aromaticum (strain DSM 19018 / LMG 30748 / EbN1) TaxID=76114 RepID=Q5NZC7_AROAE|nr:hypothetical protein ebA6070 [Aromatoleum aromaticum EbN1]
MHRFIAEDAGSGLREIGVGEQRHGAEVGAYRSLFESGGETQYIRLGFQGGDRKIVLLPAFGRLAAELRDRLRKEVDVGFVMTLELQRQVPHRRTQQPAAGAELVRGDRFVLRGERRVQDARVRGGIALARVRLGGEGRTAGEQRDRCGRQGRATVQETTAARDDQQGRVVDFHDGLRFLRSNDRSMRRATHQRGRKRKSGRGSRRRLAGFVQLPGIRIRAGTGKRTMCRCCRCAAATGQPGGGACSKASSRRRCTAATRRSQRAPSNEKNSSIVGPISRPIVSRSR